MLDSRQAQRSIPIPRKHWVSILIQTKVYPVYQKLLDELSKKAYNSRSDLPMYLKKSESSQNIEENAPFRVMF